MRIYGNTHKGLVRNSNQDNFYIDQAGEWCLVADGMGGHKGGETASALAVSVIKNYLSQNSGDTEDILRTAIVKANNEVFEHSLKVPELDGMGTTVVLLKMENNIAYIAHVGDSRAYYINGENILQLTKDHSVIQKLLDSGTITKLQAENHPQKNLITRAVGTDKYVEIDINRIICTKGDYILLCSDGLSNYVSEQQMFDIIMDNPETAVDKLIDRANSSGGIDNITAVLLCL
ncbi:MAG: Stp1/IreP family PP2C-type Ser/Thr phosphatase [Clostridia bacterium]|nr:Stp1/IreP family PP2C-type Ser/Thr phosphatase [Clostridia bacterium]